LNLTELDFLKKGREREEKSTKLLRILRARFPEEGKRERGEK
jgi:hypothetical protein